MEKIDYLLLLFGYSYFTLPMPFALLEHSDASFGGCVSARFKRARKPTPGSHRAFVRRWYMVERKCLRFVLPGLGAVHVFVFAAQMASVCCLSVWTPRVLDLIVRNISVVAPRSLRNHMRQNKPGNSPRPGRGRPKTERTRVVPEVTTQPSTDCTCHP